MNGKEDSAIELWDTTDYASESNVVCQLRSPKYEDSAGSSTLGTLLFTTFF